MPVIKLLWPMFAKLVDSMLPSTPAWFRAAWPSIKAIISAWLANKAAAGRRAVAGLQKSLAKFKPTGSAGKFAAADAHTLAILDVLKIVWPIIRGSIDGLVGSAPAWMQSVWPGIRSIIDAFVGSNNAAGLKAVKSLQVN